jgi:hypothetical protein
MTAVHRVPVTSRETLELHGFRVERVRIGGGVFPANPARRLRIIATLGAGWDLRLAAGGRRHYDHGELVLLPAWLQRQSSFHESGDNLMITVEAELIERLAAEIGLSEPDTALPFQKLTIRPFIVWSRRWLKNSDRPGIAAGSIPRRWDMRCSVTSCAAV